jgi:hypothetical protein
MWQGSEGEPDKWEIRAAIVDYLGNTRLLVDEWEHPLMRAIYDVRSSGPAVFRLFLLVLAREGQGPVSRRIVREMLNDEEDENRALALRALWAWGEAADIANYVELHGKERGRKLSTSLRHRHRSFSE